MKKLSELKISPTPWKINNIASVLDRDSVIISGQYGPYNWSNARLEAAAPDMYAALWDLLFGDIGTANCRKCKGAKLGNCKTCHLGKAREAMEKACGMEVTHEETK